MLKNPCIRLLRGNKKFAILQVSKDRLYIGVKVKGVKATPRFEDSGA
jgi:hypothetical protein